MNYANMSELEYCNIVLKRIKEYMDKNEIKQLELSRESNINQSTLSKIMSGETKLTLQHIFRICNSLKIDPEVLLSFDQEIITDNLHQIDAGLLNKRYIDDQILIRNTTHHAFKGYITEEPFFLYLYSTISSESSLLEGTIIFEDSEYHNFCKAKMCISTGKKDINDNFIYKEYYGELIISLTMGACYCVLVNKDIGEICSLYFKHTFLFNQKLVCRVATVISTSSGSNRLPIMQRALISDTKLDVNDSTSFDFDFVRGQLKLNDSEIVLSDESYTEVRTLIENTSGELKTFLSECTNSANKFNEPVGYHIFDETKIRSINVSSDTKAQGISILRKLSISPKYNKISTKTEEFTFQYINGRNTIHETKKND
jgi:transcriptional regulator with XRE-family HTH domain